MAASDAPLSFFMEHNFCLQKQPFADVLQTLFIYLFIYLFYFIYFFNSFFTVDFPMVITTNLHRLTENFIIKRKILKHFKSSHQRCIQNPVKAGDGNSLENRQPLHAVNYFLKKLHRNLIAP